MGFQDFEIREAAADVIRHFAGWDEVRALLREYPVEVAEAVVFVNEASLFPELLQLLDEPSGEVRAAGVSALARVDALGHGARFLELLGDSDPAVRGQVALALARLPREQVEAPLRAAYAREADPAARVLITDALWSLTGGW